jgi:NAD(P)H-flavin reductase
LSIDTSMTEAIAATARWQSCAIVEVATKTPAIKSFFLRLSEAFDYTAGQHVDVRLTAPNGYTAMRSYSIASAPSDSKVIELAIERLADGEVSPFFHDVAEVGDTIELRGPLGGHFLWPGPSNEPVLLIGAGSGVVPLWPWSGIGRPAASQCVSRCCSPPGLKVTCCSGTSFSRSRGRFPISRSPWR